MHLASDQRVTYFGQTNHRGAARRFGIARGDRRHHVYAIGKTGTGKSTLLRTLIRQDLEAGEGLALLDPHGDLVEEAVCLIPPSRQSDVLYLNVPDRSCLWYFNPFSGVPEQERPLAAAGMVEVFHKLWPDDWGPRLEHLLRNVVFTLLEAPGSTFADIPRLLADRQFRRQMLEHVGNRAIVEFWADEYDRYSPAFRAVVTAPLLNKVGGFLADPLVSRILTGERSSFDLRQVMDAGKVILVNLCRGRIGEGPASLLGSLLVSHIALAGLSRADLPLERRRDFYLYLDEFQTFATLTLATMLSELRKFRVSLTLAHQYLGQLAPEIRDAVFGNVGTFIAFRVGALDAPTIARELYPPFEPEDLVALPNFNIYLRLMAGGEVGRAFSARVSQPEASTS